MKKLILTSLGTLLEYYDYILFMELSYFISYLFFPNNSYSFLYIFSLGYASRFLGSLLIGIIRFEKEKIFRLSILIMSLSTLLISILPTYNSIGKLATFMFVFLRFIQSLSYAVEFPSAVSMTADSNEQEGIEKNKSSSKIGVVISSATAGSILANISSVLLLYFLTKEQILTFYWRIPFMISGIIGIVVFKYRNYDNKKNFISSSHNMYDLKYQIQPIIKSVKNLLFPASLIIIYLYLPQFFNQNGYENMYFLYKCKLFILFLSIIFVMLIGKIMDIVSKNNEINIKHVNLTHKIFIITWCILVPLSMISKFGVILLMLFIQISIAFGMHYGLKNLISHCKKSIFATVLAYNLSMFIASLITSYVTNWVYLMIIPLLLSFLIYNHKQIRLLK